MIGKRYTSPIGEDGRDSWPYEENRRLENERSPPSIGKNVWAKCQEKKARAEINFNMRDVTWGLFISLSLLLASPRRIFFWSESESNQNQIGQSRNHKILKSKTTALNSRKWLKWESCGLNEQLYFIAEESIISKSLGSLTQIYQRDRVVTRLSGGYSFPR